MSAEKTQEQRIEAAAAVIAMELTGGIKQRMQRAREVAAKTLEAADAPPEPKWPTDESGAELGYKPGADLSQLRAALLADPILKAAIDVAHSPEGGYFTAILKHAVNEAGL